MGVPIAERGYARPEALVSTDWVAGRIGDPAVRLVECSEDPLLYPAGHLPGAVEVDWRRDLCHPVRRDFVDREGFEALAGRLGIAPDTPVVFYGDGANQWAAYAFWVFRLFGHERTLLMDGGRRAWRRDGRELTREVSPAPRAAGRYRAPARDDRRGRVFREGVFEHLAAGRPLVDVRSPEEYSGERLGTPEEGALVGGHIPGARNVPWDRAVDPEDGTFRSASELREIYVGEAGVAAGDDVIVYCRIGERSAHTWFVLTQLLGHERVRNYDGSWTEWGNLVGVPVER